MTADAPVGVETLPTEEDILTSVQGCTPDMVVTKWDAFIGNIYHKDKPEQRIGGFLALRAYGIGPEGSTTRQIEIDDDHRPFDEDSITVIGARALFNAQGIRDATIVVRDGRKYAQTITRIIC